MALYDSTTGSVKAFDSYHRHQVIIGNLKIPLFFRFTQNPNSLTFSMDKEFQQTKTIGGYVFEPWGRKPITIHGTVLIKKDNSWSRVLGINDKKTNFDLEDGTYNPELLILQTLFNIDQRKMVDSQLGFLDLTKYTSGAGATSFLGKTSGFANCSNALTDPSGTSFSKVTFGDSYETPSQANIKSYINSFTDTVIYYKGCLYTGLFTKMSYTEDGKTPFTNRVDFTFLCTGTTFDYIDTLLTQTVGGRTIAALWGAASTTLTIGSMMKDLLGNVKSIIGK